MSAKQVKHYRLAWNPGTNKGYANIHVVGESKARKLPVNSASELSAISAVLKESPIYFRTTDGLIYSGWEPID